MAGAVPAHATYFAYVGPVSPRASFGGVRGPAVYLEREGFDCASAIRRDEGGQPVDAGALEAARQRWRTDHAAGGCPELARGVLDANDARRTLVMIDAEGRETTADASRGLLPLDTPAKAAAWVWLRGRELSTPTAEGSAGGLEEAYVTAVDDGFEVLSTLVDVDARPDGCDRVGTSSTYRLILRVRRDGVIEEHSRILVRQEPYFESDACMPLGRRPEGFVDVPRGGTLRGWLASAMHLEAESVRAFERLGRELEAYGAPAELVAAARHAAEDERDHA